jgi:putative heme iron utilization protein
MSERQAEIARFRDGFRTVVLATSGATGEPTASYAPYATDGAGDLFVLVSGLARHTRDLLETGRASLLFVEEESAARNIFGRRRLTCDCAVSEVPRDDPEWDARTELLRERQGKIVDMLRQLPDFRLFRLAPRRGGWVAGFARAQPLDEDELRAILADPA